MKKGLLAVLAVALCCSQAVAMTKEEEDAAWKKEPAANRMINIGYDGGLCHAGFCIAQEKGFYAAEGLTTQICRRADKGGRTTRSARGRSMSAATTSRRC